jgi:peptidoglycan/xylan/chitin deacetylase (PgdA/CDA1 family)
MLTSLKHRVLGIARTFGVFTIVAESRWRRQRLVILCYHGLSLKDEHEWCPHLYVTPELFRSRLEILVKSRYHVLHLDDAIRKLYEDALPPKSVVITFDDGYYDFYRCGLPLLRHAGLPATVYQTTYYCEHPYPIFNLVLSYLFWRGRRQRFSAAPSGISGEFDLSREDHRALLVNAFVEATNREGKNPAQKDEVAAQVASQLGVDYDEIRQLRMLQLMTPSEIAEVSRAGIDLELHTHRHRTPVDEALFTREIRDNRNWLAPRTKGRLAHFCYPSGQYRREFLPWLKAEEVISATTCEYGIVSRGTDPLLLPRQLDFNHTTANEFEGSVSGFGFLLPHRGS